jgi:endonuclease YncB( thermonuclease family)
MKSLIPAFLLLALGANAQAASESFDAHVIGVTDGDTISVRAGNTPPYKIRLAGIDAPEKKQPFGNRSKQNLSDLVFGKSVRIEWSKMDKYGRIVGKVLVVQPGACVTPCPAIDANLAQVASGFAWHYKQYEQDQPWQDRQSYAAAELNARQHKLGLWQDASPVAPWQWRHTGHSHWRGAALKLAAT